jgi:hypothetical protein
MQMLNYGLLVGAMTWLLLVVRGAQTLKNHVDQRVYDVVFGPLTLLHINRHPIEGGFTVKFSLGTGLLWYFVLWVSIGSILGLILALYTHRAVYK